MTVMIKSCKGPMHQDIFPVIARSKDQLEKAYDQLMEFIKDEGGVDVYRILEGTGTQIAGMDEGDVILMPFGKKMEGKDLVLVASYSGEPKEVLEHFRFKTKRKWNKEALPVPPAPAQWIEKYHEQETVKNRPKKGPDIKTGTTGTQSKDGEKDVYSSDLNTVDVRVFHFMPEYEKKKVKPNLDDPMMCVKIELTSAAAILFKVLPLTVVYEQNFTSEEIAAVVMDTLPGSDVLAAESDVRKIHMALATYLGTKTKPEGDSGYYDIYKACLGLMKSYCRTVFLSEYEKRASEARGEKCRFSHMAEAEIESIIDGLTDDMETDRDIIIDILMESDGVVS